MDEYTLYFDTDIYCIDENCGQFTKVAFDHRNWRVMDLVVEKGMILKRARVFPFSAVTAANSDQITLDIHQDEIKNYPEYTEEVVEKVPEGGHLEPAIIQGSPHGLATESPFVPMVRERIITGVADHLDVLDKNTLVEATDQTVGKVRGFAVEPTNGLITRILVHRGTIFTDEFWVTSLMIDRISKEGVFLTVSEADLEERIEYDEVREYYWNRMPTDESLEPVTSATDGSLNNEKRERYESIITDETALATLINQSLMDDPHTCDAVIEVILSQGMVTLKGNVDSPETKKVAEEIVSAYPGVVSLSNELVVDPQ